MHHNHPQTQGYLYAVPSDKENVSFSRNNRFMVQASLKSSNLHLKFVQKKGPLLSHPKSLNKTSKKPSFKFVPSSVILPVKDSSKKKNKRQPKNQIEKRRLTENKRERTVSVKKLFPFNFKDLVRNRSRESSLNNVSLHGKSFKSLTNNPLIPLKNSDQSVRNSRSISILKCLREREKKKEDHLRRSLVKGGLGSHGLTLTTLHSLALRNSSFEKSLSGLSVLLKKGNRKDLFKEKKEGSGIGGNAEDGRVPSISKLVEHQRGDTRPKRKRNTSKGCFPFCYKKTIKKEDFILNDIRDAKKTKKKNDRPSSLMRLKNSLISIFVKKKKSIRDESDQKQFEKNFIGKLQDSIKKGKQLIELKAKMAKKKAEKTKNDKMCNSSLKNHIDSKQTLKCSNLSFLVESDSMEQNQLISQVMNQKGVPLPQMNHFLKPVQNLSNHNSLFFSQKKHLIGKMISPESHPKSDANILSSNTNSLHVNTQTTNSYKFGFEKKSTKAEDSCQESSHSKEGSDGLIVNNFSMFYSKNKSGKNTQRTHLDQVFDYSSESTRKDNSRSIKSIDFSQYVEQIDGKNSFFLWSISI
jgi:hypothetical protein